ncbi:MAG: DUF1194 domain-containing protein [Pseudomonadota bacterium]
MYTRRRMLAAGASLVSLTAIPAVAETLHVPGLSGASPDTAPVQSGEVPVKLYLMQDASESMLPDEFRLQVSGTAAALRSDEVKRAIAKIGAVAICGGQFSSQTGQTLPHALLRTPEEVDNYADLIEQQSRMITGFTHISDALNEAAKTIGDSPYQAQRNVIDISGDGFERRYGDMNRSISADEQLMLHATRTREATRRAAFDFDACVNGLAICTDRHDLDRYFEEVVVTPPEVWEETGVDVGRAWAVTAFEDIEMAMRSKLITELAGLKTPYNAPNISGRIVHFG